MSPKRKTFIFLIVSQMIYAFFSVAWLIMIAVYGFLTQGSGQVHPGIRALFAYLQAYPGGLLLALILGWTYYAKGKYKPAVWWNLLPLLWVIPYLGILIYTKFFA